MVLPAGQQQGRATTPHGVHQQGALRHLHVVPRDDVEPVRGGQQVVAAPQHVHARVLAPTTLINPRLSSRSCRVNPPSAIPTRWSPTASATRSRASHLAYHSSEMALEWCRGCMESGLHGGRAIMPGPARARSPHQPTCSARRRAARSRMAIAKAGKGVARSCMPELTTSTSGRRGPQPGAPGSPSRHASSCWQGLGLQGPWRLRRPSGAPGDTPVYGGVAPQTTVQGGFDE